MLTLRDPAKLASISQLECRQLIQRRITEITEPDGYVYDPDLHGYFIIIEPGDDIAKIEAATSCHILSGYLDQSGYGDETFSPSWEWMEEHAGGLFEMVFVLSDSGFGIVVLVPDRAGINADLLRMCAEYAQYKPNVIPLAVSN